VTRLGEGIDDCAQLNGIRERLEAAENAGDVQAIVATLAADAVLLVPDFPVQEGRAACAAFLGALLPSLLSEFDRRIEYTSDEVKRLGDAAFDRGRFAFTVAPRTGGEPRVVTGKYLWLYTQTTPGRWELARMVVTRDDPGEHDQP
jgi:ketosteroid isomerase-like protein